MQGEAKIDRSTPAFGGCAIAAYPGNGMYNAVGTPFGNAVVSEGAVTTVTTRTGQALSFNGQFDVGVPTRLFSSGSGQAWIRMWVTPSALPADYAALVYWTDPPSSQYLNLYVKASGKLALYYAGNTTNNYDGTGTYSLSVGVKYCIDLVWDSIASKCCVYVNGLLDALFTASTLNAPTNTMVFGNDYNNVGRHYSGLMEHIALFTRAPSALEIMRFYLEPWRLYRQLTSPTFFNLAAPRDLISIRESAMLGTTGPVLGAVGPVAMGRRSVGQPQGARRVNWASPLAKGLRIAYIPGNATDFASGLALSTQRTTKPGPAGIATDPTVGATFTEFAIPANSSSDTAVRFDLPVLTAMVVARQPVSTNAGVTFCRGHGSGTPGWSVGLHGGSQQAPIATFGSYSGALGSVPNLAGYIHTVAVTADGTTIRTYLDGALWDSGAYVSPGYQYDPSPLNHRSVIVGSNGQGNGSGTECYLALLWDRALLPIELASLTANPWQLFVTNNKTIWGAR
jgi:hypothetical protein